MIFNVKLCSSDKTTHNCDILVGADGIHSTPTVVLPRNSGCWAVMALKPYAEAQASIGQGIDIDDAREYAWIGNGTFLMHNVLSEGQLVQLVLTAYEEQAVGSDRWHRTVSADEIRRLYNDWPPHLKNGIGQASGGGMSVEDSFLLSSLLSHATSPTEALNALKAYDEVRRPRTQRIVESSRGTGEIMTGRGGETEMPLDQIREKLVHRWDFIFDIKLDEHRDEAITIMNRLNLSQ
ncbi:hypothetical protein KVR01_009237 [Diaporthe batatas]|uniref:uncharacterized protein n=1 Tax=Diaporthe batatas TaxID=748121 RepID=UPI001D0519BC|nr:uncharacterized protein KVR01_009237 [Diaporthe batatas]KAG8160973.1 hypothetical protein KVR01_009237 [Diaporthe batatas]